MRRLHAEATAVIPAPPATVYGILADYHNGHPHILPKEYFAGLTVEVGGQGAGTIFVVRTRELGRERAYRMVVREPEPGRVLTETDESSGLVTTFTVTPIQAGQQARVQIATDWEARPGLAGIVEGLVMPMLMRRVFLRELAQFAAYVQGNG